jgi:hypothetical protein
LACQHEDVQRVTIIAQGARNTSILARVVDGGEQRAVQAENMQSLVVFILVGVTAGNLDDGVDQVWGVCSDG